jgi:hypothetical protein
MKTTSISAGLLLSLSFLACRPSESTNGTSTANAAMLSVQTEGEATKVLKEYYKALTSGDSVKARSLATGTALAVLEYRFFRSTQDDDLRISYGSQNILRDTCYIPIQIKANDRDRSKEGKAILVKVDGAWKVERIAMQK